MNKYTPASYKLSAFNCPNCGAFAEQKWHGISFLSHNKHHTVHNIDYCLCSHCDEYSLWREKKMLFPTSGNAPFANADLPKEIKKDYEEAREIVATSPRAAAAFLRLIIQELCKYLGEKSKNLNEAIKNLVKRGLPVKIEDSLRLLRVIGTRAIPPGKIDKNDNAEIAEKLFIIVNLITVIMITQPNEIEHVIQSSNTDKK